MARTDPTSPQVAAARRAGVRDARVLDAVAAVPRVRFVPEAARGESHLDRPIRIGDGQTTSQPSLIAAMLEALELTGDERVLEIGTGHGYQTALLSHLAAEVRSVERFPGLARRAVDNLAACGIRGVTVTVGDGTRGAPDAAPFDAIVVSAAAAQVPAALADQLREGGRLVAPLGPPGEQVVVVHQRHGDHLVERGRLSAVRFVPLVADDADR